MPFSDLSSHFETILLKRINLSLKFNPNLILIILKKSKTISTRSKVAFECYSGHNFHFKQLQYFSYASGAHTAEKQKKETILLLNIMNLFANLFIYLLLLLHCYKINSLRLHSENIGTIPFYLFIYSIQLTKYIFFYVQSLFLLFL